MARTKTPEAPTAEDAEDQLEALLLERDTMHEQIQYAEQNADEAELLRLVVRERVLPSLIDRARALIRERRLVELAPLRDAAVARMEQYRAEAERFALARDVYEDQRRRAAMRCDAAAAEFQGILDDLRGVR